MSVPSFKGYPNFTKLLTAVGSKKELSEVRAIVMQSIWALDFTAPGDILAQVMSDSGTDRATMEEFMGQFFALYNQLADHQDPGTPFRLFPFPRIDTYAALKGKLLLRQREMQEFTPLFTVHDRFANEALLDKVSALLSRVGTCIDDLGSLIDSVADEDQAKLPTAVQAMTQLDQKFEATINEVGQVYKQERKALMLVNDVMGDMRGPGDHPDIPGEKVGRNDPCPCGSGKKYKKCCLA